MIKLKLEANSEEEKLIKEYLENNVSETLAEKINNGTKIIKDNETLLNKKDLNGFLKYASEEARKSAKNGVAMIHHETVFNWVIHYFEEDTIEGTLYNDDGTEYKKIVKIEYKPPIAKVEVQKKPENEQANFLDIFNSHNEQQEIEEVEEKIIEEKTVQNPLTREQMELLVNTFDEPELEEELRQLKKQEEKEKQTLKAENIDIETGEVLQPINNKENEYIEILQQIFDYKLEVLL